jgi:catechol 2,3-dioxygenase-like lactoylglutathione lyase family enzyme
MEPQISLITLGVTDLERAIHFYRDGLGWPHSSVGAGEVAFFHTKGTVLALYPHEALAADAGLPVARPGFSGITLAHNVRSRELVDVVMEEAIAAGAALVKAARELSWGGYVGYIADPDDHVWEIAWNPGFSFADDGSLLLPE